MIIKILPRLENEDLNISLGKNENLLTSTLYKFIQLVDFLNKDNQDNIVIMEDDKEYDVIYSRWMGDEINTFDKSKPIYEFNYDGLNDGWFFDRYTDENGKTYDVYEGGDYNEDIASKLSEILGEIFFRIELVNNPDL